MKRKQRMEASAAHLPVALPRQTAMQSEIDVSILIVSWNCKSLLGNCLDSLREQVPEHTKQIVVVDNASSDGTSEFVRLNFPDVEFLETGANIGFARGNNVGLAACRGEYVCLINPDVVAERGCIARMLCYMNEHEDVGMVGPQILGTDGIVQRSCMREPSLWNQFSRAMALDTLFGQSKLFGGYLMKDFDHAQVREVEILNGCFWMVRREALAGVGGLDDRFWMYSEDVDWCRRFRLAGWRVVFYPDAGAIHHGGGSSRNNPVSSFVQMQHANLLYWRKYHGALSSLCFRAILSIGHFVRCCAFLIAYVAAAARRPELRARLSRHFAAIRHLMQGGAQGSFSGEDGAHVRP